MLKKILVITVIFVSLASAAVIFIAGHQKKMQKIATCLQYAREAVKGTTDPLKTLQNIEFIKLEVKRGTISWDDLGHYDEDYLDEIVETRRPELINISKKVVERLMTCQMPRNNPRLAEMFFLTIEDRVKDGIFSWQELGIKEAEFKEAKNKCLGQKS